jgi:hypothetical protein
MQGVWVNRDDDPWVRFDGAWVRFDGAWVRFDGAPDLEVTDFHDLADRLDV